MSPCHPRGPALFGPTSQVNKAGARKRRQFSYGEIVILSDRPARLTTAVIIGWTEPSVICLYLGLRTQGCPRRRRRGIRAACRPPGAKHSWNGRTSKLRRDSVYKDSHLG